jgi:hypothetical protein
MLRKGQRLRPLHPHLAEREWGVSGDEVGTVLCCYRVLVNRAGAADRVDVEFGSGQKIWGAPAAEFAVIPEGASAH